MAIKVSAGELKALAQKTPSAPEVKPAPPPTQPKKRDVATAALTAKTAKALVDVAKVTQEVADALRAMPQQADNKPTVVRLNVVRDTSGLIDYIDVVRQ